MIPAHGNAVLIKLSCPNLSTWHFFRILEILANRCYTFDRTMLTFCLDLCGELTVTWLHVRRINVPTLIFNTEGQIKINSSASPNWTEAFLTDGFGKDETGPKKNNYFQYCQFKCLLVPFKVVLCTFEAI